MNKKELKQIRNFHGHLGHYVILGYRMGKFAQRRLNIIDVIKAYLPKNPPQSCLLDGLQLSTGCTLGRNEIKVIIRKKLQKVIFYKNNKKLVITLSELARELIKEFKIKKIISTKLNKLFTIN